MTLRTLPFVLLVALMLASVPAPAQQAPSLPPQDPILRIDPDMHTARINRIGVDAACTLLATGSHDKTVRLWRLPEGKLLRTLRPLIGPGDDGRVSGVAVAPDGSWVAVGGLDAAWKVEGGHFVYVFDVSTGALVARVGPLSTAIRHLAVSPDGRHLAAILGGGKGLSVWERTGTAPVAWRLVREDGDYGGQDAYGAAFDRAGTLYTTAYDGKLRRYAPGFHGKPSAVATRGGRRPFSVAVHPSGDKVAVGYTDSTQVDLYDAATLAWRFAADTTSATKGNLSSVAWSADGTRLHAAGQFIGGQSDRPILVWDRAGQGRAYELGGPGNTMLHLLPCGSGIAMAAADPAFGLLAPDGSRLAWRGPVQADLRGQRGSEDFAVARDGRRVRFGLEEGGLRPVLFDLGTDQLEDAPVLPSDMVGPDTTSLPIADWINNRAPKLNGAPIVLTSFEQSRSLAITPDKQGFVLGADWSLRRYDKTGKLLWRRTVLGVTWAVNVARDGRVVLAGHGDGTVRWHRLSDGAELLALFVHKEDKRWVAWTPKGYYMASPGGESLIGWHVNRDWDEAARFYPVDRFRKQFNRPDIVKLVLETLDEGKAIEEANGRAKITRAEVDVRKIAPPIVTVQDVSPVQLGPSNELAFRSPNVTIKYDVFSETGKEISGVEVRVNHSRLRSNFKPGDRKNKYYTSGEHIVSLQPRDVTITLVARDEDDNASEPVTVRLRWDGAKPGQIELPRLRALLVGNNAYPAGRLQFAVKDAHDMAAFFKKHEGKTYSKVETKVLTDARSADVIKALEWLREKSEEGTDTDVNLLFLAGHGKSDERQQFFYLGVDSDPDELATTAVSQDHILSLIRYRKGAMVVMLDACHSGAGTVDMNRTANELGDRTLGVLLYASAQGHQYALERKEWGNGAFTRAMIEGLSGEADRDKLGYVEADELGTFVRRRVMTMTDGQQTPKSVNHGAVPEMRLVLLK